MFDSGVFDYVNVLGKAADAAWQRNEIISNNMSNVNTPGYKRKDIDFESRLRQALGSSRYEAVDTKVACTRPGMSPLVLTATMWTLTRKA